MKKINQEELDYLYSKINFGASNLDAKAIDIMNRSAIVFSQMEEEHKVMQSFINSVDSGEVDTEHIYKRFKEFLDR